MDLGKDLTMTGIRYGTGGFEDRFRVTRTDGKPVRAEARYLVLDYANDPHAKVRGADFGGCGFHCNTEIAA
jgi:hypothetical protein